MKRFICVCVIALFGIFSYEASYARTIKPILNKPYIAVYGRPECQVTNSYLRELQKPGVNCVFINVDKGTNGKELIGRMEEAGFDTDYFNLPVIDVSGNLSIRMPYVEVWKLYYESPNKRRAVTAEKTKKSSDPLNVTGIVMGGEPIALLESGTVRVGDKVGEYTVAEIGSNLVRFRDTQGRMITRTIK